MQAADTDQVAGIMPGGQVNRFILELISFGSKRLIPWFPQDFPPECVIASNSDPVTGGRMSMDEEVLRCFLWLISKLGSAIC